MHNKSTKTPNNSITTPPSRSTTRQIATAALLFAICYISTTYLQIRLPLASGGNINLGQVVILILPLFLPLHSAIIVAALSCGLADITLGAAQWLGATIIIKTLMVLCAYKVRPRFAGYSLAMVTMMLGYTIYDILFITRSIVGAGVSLVSYLIESIVAITLALILAKFIDNSLAKFKH